MLDLSASTALVRSRDSLDRLQEKAAEEKTQSFNHRFMDTMAKADKLLDGAMEVGVRPNGVTTLKLLRGPYKGTVWAYGQVSLYEIPGSPQVGTRFEYQIFENKEVDGLEFKEYLAKILNYLIIITYDHSVLDGDYVPDIDLTDGK